LLGSALLLTMLGGLYAQEQAEPEGGAAAVAPTYPDPSQCLTRATRGTDKLPPELRTLYRQWTVTRGRRGGLYTPSQLAERFGLVAGEPNPGVAVAVTLAPGAEASALEKAGVLVQTQVGNVVYAEVPVLSLDRVAQASAVQAMRLVRPGKVPAPPEVMEAPVQEFVTRGQRGPGPLADAFDHQGLTGKGVLVAVLDTGIDWKHQDFTREDGTSRILYLYDSKDDSWTTSQQKIGTAPPLKTEKGPLGTLYTNEQINAALKGQGTVGSQDIYGHGTACAGTAAGNGRATGNDVPAGTYMGVAPQADLIIVKAGTGPGVSPMVACLGAEWVAKQAKALGRPCVMSLSFGNQDHPHQGCEPDELIYDSLVGKGKPGLAICASAGNDRMDNFHAGGRFGPRVEGQADVTSPPIELFVTAATYLTAYFDRGDEWGLAVVGLDNFFVDEKGNSLSASFFVQGTKLSAATMQKGQSYKGPICTQWRAPGNPPKDLTEYFSNQDYVTFDKYDDTTQRLGLYLPPGAYLVFGYAFSEKVASGRYDLYLPFLDEASFGKRTEARYLVGAPGNASNIITVGSYDVRNEWINLDGKRTRHNLVLGALSDYSNPGYRRDGVVKPDVVAPGRYMISPLARVGDGYCKMGSRTIGGKDVPRSGEITRDGYHLAWPGTSASTPYVAGVVALMLEKNPSLDAAQIADILRRTARTDEFTGGAPNPEWGYGKINPETALKATPAP